MKHISTLLYFLPIALYLVFLILNFSVLAIKSDVNFFYLYSGEVQIVLFSSIFFILYAVIIWSIFKFSNFFSGLKKGKLENKVNSLKAELHDNQGDLIASIKKEFELSLAKHIEQSDKEKNTYKIQADKTLGNLEFEVKNIKEKIDKLNTK